MKKLRHPIIFLLIICFAVFTTSCSDRLAKKAAKGWMAAQRPFVTTDDEPWKMFEGIYAFGANFLMVDSVTQERTQALSYIAAGSISGLIKKDAVGPYFAGRVGKSTGEPHRNQFLADLISARVDSNTDFVTDTGDTAQILEFTNRAMQKVDPDTLAASNTLITGLDGNELGWTLIAFSRAQLVLSSWTNEKGRQVYFTDLLQVALDRPIEWGSDEGLNEQIGIAVALYEYKKNRLSEALAAYDAFKKKNVGAAGEKPAIDTIELRGIWKEAQDHVDKVIAILKKNQNFDGTFSKSWHTAKKPSRDLGELLLFTGQALDFLAVALNDNQLKEDWMRKTVTGLSGAIIKNKYRLQDKNWALTRAAHALMFYRFRIMNTGNPFPKSPDGTSKSGCCG